METLQKQVPILDLNPEVEELWTELNAAVQGVMRSTQFIMGNEVKVLEQELAQYLGTKHAIAVNSGTDALVIGLKAMGIGEGDEVLTTPFTFFATAESISIVGAKPVFVDIDEKSFNIDPAKIEAQITDKTKAIMPVHLYGNPAAMNQIMAIAAKHGLKVIEDCAQSFGATYQDNCSGCDGSCTPSGFAGKKVGTIGDVGAYSFFPSKNLGCYGDGGLITTDDDAVADIARMLRVHGAKKKYHNEVLGYNSRLDTMQAAILRVKLPHIEKWNAHRLAAGRYYNQAFEGVAGIITPDAPDGHVFHQYTIRLTTKNRDEVQAQMQAQGIGTMVYYPIPQDQLPIYKGQYAANPVSDALAAQVLSLPMGHYISKEDQDQVIAILSSVLS
jgi:dTDP-4-amino-4,6-dideoxygalactose transaminase